MRPVDKGTWPTSKKVPGKLLLFNDWKRALKPLKDRTGWYCHLCEMRVNNHMSIEHIKHRDAFPKLASSWTNFLLACGYCNSRKRAKSPEAPYRKRYVWPHIHNTLLAFDVPLAGGSPGTVQVNSSLQDPVLKTRAQALIDLYALEAQSTSDGGADVRFIERMAAVHMAATRRVEYDRGQATAQAVVDMAKVSGFFSVWFKVFADVPQIKALLIAEPAFALNAAWFDANLDPLPRVQTEGV